MTDLKQIAVNVRADIKAAIKAGSLPKGIKVSVTTDYYSMGCALRVRVSALPEGLEIANPKRVAHQAENPRWSYWTMPADCQDNLGTEGRAIMTELDRIVSVYHEDKSYDSGGDRITNQNFHKSISFGGGLIDESSARLYAALTAPAAPAAPAPAAAAVAPAERPRVYLRAVSVPRAE